MVLFTFLTTTVLHLEIAKELSTHSFLISIRQLISRRGIVKIMGSDNWMNFVRASTELKENINSLII